ncbi:hypothetical protein D9613_003564 [Agrocybe pediades]|uniref:Nephrocystin 3-like N-terminal domain-containing protein n=1 Tax=Agrocybe pediades TaxID=84607 RepID=A0A8H4QJU8_9AGAR|nr:hypothetical protein D9613_003564 [Agrocybe pediades]
MSHPGAPFPSLMSLSHSIVAGGTFTQHIDQRQCNHSGPERPGYARLLQKVATSALHDSVHVVDPPKCHPNTRVAIIQSIIDWGLGKDEELNGKPILWLKGAAGAGKSAIARSVAERCSDEGLLLGTFFFGAGDPNRNHVEKLVATISYQISTVLPGFRDTVASIIEDDMLIFDRSIRTQFSTLVVRPLSIVLANHSAALTATPRLIIIDGLDECSSIESQRDLLFSLQEVTNTTTFIQFLVCSRPESHLNGAFRSSSIVPILHTIFLDVDYSVREDIQKYLEDKFKQIKEEHVFKQTLPDPWPAPEMVHALVKKSSGQFIYAATVVRYIESPKHKPDQRLRAIFKLRPPFKDLPFTELDTLYRHIICKAEDLSTVLDIFAFPVLYGWFDIRAIELILELEQGDVEVMVAELHSIVTISDGLFVAFLHKSLADFFSEPQRSGDLYRDLSKAQLSHSHHGQETDIGNSMIRPLDFALVRLSDSNNMKADYVSSDIVQITRQFPMFEFGKPLLTYGRTRAQYSSYIDWEFLQNYLHYLYYIKDVSEATTLVYWEQLRQYCECVLAVLDDHWAGDWSAHFVYAYSHLLHGARCRLPRKLSYVDLVSDLDMDVGAFGETILRLMIWSLHPHFDEIAKLSRDLMDDIKQGAIFAMSASFCLALLCNEQTASRAAGRIYGISGNDRHKKREHPWRWRHMLPGRRSVGNRLSMVVIRRDAYTVYYKMRLMKIRRVFRDTARYKSTRIITMLEYFRLKSKLVPDTWPMTMYERPRQWPLYIFLLDLIPHILPLAGRYEPLVKMCRKKCFSSLSQFWPRKSRRARQAIESYLRRMDSEEECE